MSWVWDHSYSVGSARLVLLAIADSADHDGSNAWPSIATLTKKTRLGERTVRDAIRQLESIGELRTEFQKGGPADLEPHERPNRYTVLMRGGARSAPGGGATGGARSAPKPSLDPSLRENSQKQPETSSTDTPEARKKAGEIVAKLRSVS